VVKRSVKASWAQQLWQWMLVTVKIYLTLTPDDIERNIPDWVFPTQQNLPTRHQSRPDGVLVMPIEGRGRHLDPKQIPPKDRDIHLVEFKFCSDIKLAIDIRKSAQPTSTSYPAPTNKEPPRHLSKHQSHTSCYTFWSRGHNLQSVHHNSSTKLGHPHAQSAPTSY